eukprot:CAMPEP_0173249768 /NCGR_PEP_ID=MMETSP1142-20121109/19200_1 /TAXON_ID=483371 /ORGANISM="non described non described, Strain CCMP2298" /LENGTH=95 /DNA_ID=CAMNT_0014182427 /DNA_START=204 /DNA_END=491 /DNA_ORIENTATION=-
MNPSWNWWYISPCLKGYVSESITHTIFLPLVSPSAPRPSSRAKPTPLAFAAAFNWGKRAPVTPPGSPTRLLYSGPLSPLSGLSPSCTTSPYPKFP